MRLSKITALVLALSIAASGPVSGNDIFKWTDEDGNVHFSDRPTEYAERLAIQSRPTDPARIQAEAQTRVKAETERAEAKAAAPQGPTPEEQRADAQERKDKCNEYTNRQVQFTQNRRIYSMDESGERVYYNEEEMATARARVDGLVNEYCN